MSYDVIVAGSGGMGSAAYHLAGRGEKVLGLERHTPAHDKGSSHGRSRIIRQAYFEGSDYVPLLLRAYELWEDLERASGSELMTLTGGLMIGRREGALVSGSAASATCPTRCWTQRRSGATSPPSPPPPRPSPASSPGRASSAPRRS